jgi:NACHT domain
MVVSSDSHGKTSTKSKKALTPLTREENPRWLTADPKGRRPTPPANTKVAALPLLEIGWENFERLCRRLAERSGDVEKAWGYGTPGQTQFGIDILVRLNDGTIEVWQSKRHKRFGAADVKTALALFLSHDFATTAKRFVLALACPLSSTGVIDEIQRATTQLADRGIAFEPIGSTELTDQLRQEAEIVDDFFGRPWVDAACGPEAAAALANRVSRFDLEGVRDRLRQFYPAWIASVDPGLPIAGQDKDGAPVASPALAQRYVLPDLLMDVSIADQEEAVSTAPKPLTRDDPAVQSIELQASGFQRAVSSAPRSRERMLSVDQFLASEKRAVITADAGAGKTTLLRFLALEILSETPEVEAVRNIYASYIPIWVSFALWCRMAEGKDHPPPLEDVVHAFIKSQSDAAFADDVKRSLGDNKIILLVDGLDEARGSAASETILSGLTTFVELRNVSVIATSRPHGMRALSAISGSWAKLRLAPLSEAKRDALALLWYRILERNDLGASAAARTVENQAQHRANSFTSALARNAGISRLSFTPLFLVALLKLHRAGRDLPRNRFEASKEIVDQLLEHQPRRRAKDAVETKNPILDSRMRDRLLEEFAYGLHRSELRGSVADGAFVNDAVAHAAKLIMTRTGNTNLDAAEDSASSVFSFSEESAGILVKKSPDSIGFLHRLLQEYLVARKLVQSSLPDKIEFIKGHATQSDWSEPILYLLFLVTNEHEVGQLLEAIEQAPASSVTEKAVRDAVLTEATFADFSHDLICVRRIANNLFAEAELFAWGTRQQQLLASVTDGLFSQSISAHCANKLSEWVPDYHGSGRASAVLAMRDWDVNLRPACKTALLRIIAGENDYVWRHAGQVLSEFAAGDQATKDALLQLLHRPRSVDTLHASLFALGRGWKADADVAAIALNLRQSEHVGIKADAIRIRAERGEADLTDLELFAPLAFEKEPGLSNEVFAPDLVSYFGKHFKAETVAHIERGFNASRSRNDEITLVGSLIAADPSHSLIAPTLTTILSKDYAFADLFGRSNILVDRVTWTPEHIALIEDHLNKDQFLDYETYWISKVLPLPFVKNKMLASLKEDHSLAFWASRGLLEGWGKDDHEVQEAFKALLSGSTDKIAHTAKELPLVIDDTAAVRQAILRAFAAKPRRMELLVAGIRNLDLPADDEEAFQACYGAGSLTNNMMYDDMWRKELIRTYSARPEVRALAIAELAMRDGNLDAVAYNYKDDADMCARVLKVACPLSKPFRLTLVSQLELAAQSSELAESLLGRARFDTDGAISGTAIMGWAETNVAHGSLDQAKEAFLADELNAVGPQLHHRHAAGVIGLGMADKLTAFATSMDYQGRPRCVDVGHIALSRDDDRYMRRMLPMWDRFVAALESEKDVIERLQISPETCLTVLNPGVRNAGKLFALMMAAIPTARHVNLHEHISVLARFQPDSDAMRDLIMPLVLLRGRSRTNGDTWAAMSAAEIFAEHFSQRPALLKQVVDSFAESPTRSCAAAALAEIVLRNPDAAIEHALRQNGLSQDYEIAALFKVVAAVGTTDMIIDALVWLLHDRPTEIMFWNCAYWVPSLLRRIEREPAIGDAMIEASATAPNASAKISLIALAGRAGNGRVTYHDFFATEAGRVAAAVAPPIGFDVTVGGHRLAGHLLHELLT